ncbi:MAG: hypothetical protein D6707_03165, partial [Bacteroidetes bacterium]
AIKRRVVVEAGSSWGWERYAGTEGRIIALNSFGKSAPQNQLMKFFGFTIENIVKQVKELLSVE